LVKDMQTRKHGWEVANGKGGQVGLGGAKKKERMGKRPFRGFEKKRGGALNLTTEDGAYNLLYLRSAKDRTGEAGGKDLRAQGR